MRLFRRRSERGTPAAEGPATPPAQAPAPARPGVSITVTATSPSPTCSQCGRTDLPIVGGWDPPICQDCDAAINEDAMQAEELGS